MPDDVIIGLFAMEDVEEDEEDCCMAVMAAAAVVSTVSIMRAASYRKQRQRSIWVRPLYQRRSQFGAYNMVMAELRQSDSEMYAGFTRMSVDDFDTLLLTIKEDIMGSSRFRMPISPEVKLAVTLRYLATGKSIMNNKNALTV